MFVILNVFLEKSVQFVCGISILFFSLLVVSQYVIPEFFSFKNRSVLYKLTIYAMLCSTALNIYFEYYSVMSKLSGTATYPS